MIAHDGFDLDQTAGGLWRCVHSKSRVAGVGLTPEEAKAACDESMKVAKVGAPEPIGQDDTTPIETPKDLTDG